MKKPISLFILAIVLATRSGFSLAENTAREEAADVSLLQLQLSTSTPAEQASPLMMFGDEGEAKKVERSSASLAEQHRREATSAAAGEEEQDQSGVATEKRDPKKNIIVLSQQTVPLNGPASGSVSRLVQIAPPQEGESERLQKNPEGVQKYLQDTIRKNIYTTALLEVARMSEQAKGTFCLPQQVEQEWDYARVAAEEDVRQSERQLENAEKNQLLFGSNEASAAGSNLAPLAFFVAQARRETAHATRHAINNRKTELSSTAEAALQAAQEAEAKARNDYEGAAQTAIEEVFESAQEQWATFQQAVEQYHRHPDLKNAQATTEATEQARLAAEKLSQILKSFSPNASKAVLHAAKAAENATRTSGVFGWATKSADAVKVAVEAAKRAQQDPDDSWKNVAAWAAEAASGVAGFAQSVKAAKDVTDEAAAREAIRLAKIKSSEKGVTRVQGAHVQGAKGPVTIVNNYNTYLQEKSSLTLDKNKWKEKETALKNQKLRLDEKAKKLATDKKHLAEERARLQELWNKATTEAKMAYQEQLDALTQQEQAVLQQERELQAAQEKFENEKKAFDQKKQELEQRDSALTLQEQALERERATHSQKAATERAAIDQEKQELTKKEEELEMLQESLEEQERDLETQRFRLEVDRKAFEKKQKSGKANTPETEALLQQQRQALEERGAALHQTQEAWRQQSDDLIFRKNLLATEMKALEEKGKELLVFEKELAQQKSALADKSLDVEARIAAEQQRHAEREEELNQRSLSLRDLEERLTEQERQLQQREEELKSERAALKTQEQNLRQDLLQEKSSLSSEAYEIKQRETTAKEKIEHLHARETEIAQQQEEFLQLKNELSKVQELLKTALEEKQTALEGKSTFHQNWQTVLQEKQAAFSEKAAADLEIASLRQELEHLRNQATPAIVQTASQISSSQEGGSEQLHLIQEKAAQETLAQQQFLTQGKNVFIDPEKQARLDKLRIEWKALAEKYFQLARVTTLLPRLHSNRDKEPIMRSFARFLHQLSNEYFKAIGTLFTGDEEVITCWQRVFENYQTAIEEFTKAMGAYETKNKTAGSILISYANRTQEIAQILAQRIEYLSKFKEAQLANNKELSTRWQTVLDKSEQTIEMLTQLTSVTIPMDSQHFQLTLLGRMAVRATSALAEQTECWTKHQEALSTGNEEVSIHWQEAVTRYQKVAENTTQLTLSSTTEHYNSLNGNFITYQREAAMAAYNALTLEELIAKAKAETETRSQAAAAQSTVLPQVKGSVP